MTPPSRSFTDRRPPSFVASCGALLFLFVTSVFAADTQTRTFDLPADTGDRAIKRFSEQSGLEVVFGTATAARVKTNAVRGDLPPREALARMLQGTGLVVVPNEKTGALTVSRDPNGPEAAQATAGDLSRDSEKKKQTGTARTQEPMKSNKLLTTLTSVVALFAGSPASAQNAAAGSATVEGRVLNVTSGQYVKNARITVAGTTLEAFSNEFGEYRLTNVPGGEVIVKAAYGGLPSVSQPVAVAAGQRIVRDFNLGAADGAPQGDGRVVKLDEFIVSSSRETNASAIATNEQRYAPNIKNVVSSDAFGDVTEGNVGEFLKYLPGISVDYVAADVRTISVRGFADTFTGVNVDGGRMASVNSGSANRGFEVEQVSLNNVARVEVTKVPTPEMPADGLGGSINMVSRSAFEQTRPTFRYRVSLSMNSEDRDLFKKTPGPGNKNTFKVLPGFDFNYIAPLSKTFGIAVNGLHSGLFNEQHRSLPGWTFGAAGTGATPATPFLQNYVMQDGPKVTFRDSLAVKADWKFAPNHVLSFGGQANHYKAFFGNRNISYGTGSISTPTTPDGTPLMFSPTFTQGATGRGTVVQGGTFIDKLGATVAANLTYRFTGRNWESDFGASISRSRNWQRDLSRGQLQAVNTSLQNVSTVRYDDITYPRPGTIIVRNAAGQPIDAHTLSNYNITNVFTGPQDGQAVNRAAYLNVKRNLDLRGVPLALKTGVAIRSEARDNRRNSEGYTFVGADGLPNTADDNAGQFLDEKYSPEDPYWGFRPIQWADPYRLAVLFRSHPNYFSSATTAVGNETNRINRSEKFDEVISSAFVQGEARLFRNRLRIVTGVRYEKTRDTGEGPLFDPDAPFQRNASGAFIRDAAGARMRKPEAGAPGSLEELRLVRKERAGRGNKSYDSYNPSFHSTYNITDNLLARFAYAQTFGRPSFTDIVPNTIIDEADIEPAPGVLPGNITVKNPGLLPWTAQNYDATLEYYFEKGGVVSVSGFQKNIENFWNSIRTILTPELATELGLEQRYVGWFLNTRQNGGDSKISGVELNYNQGLAFIPGWGKHFSLAANMTRLHLEGERAADFSNFVSRTGNVGLTFNRRPLNVKVNLNYKGRQKQGQFAAIQGWRYEKERRFIDVNFEYQFSRQVTLFVNGRNITLEPRHDQNIGINPNYSYQATVEEYGVQWTFGLKGSF